MSTALGLADGTSRDCMEEREGLQCTELISRCQLGDALLWPKGSQNFSHTIMDSERLMLYCLELIISDLEIRSMPFSGSMVSVKYCGKSHSSESAGTGYSENKREFIICFSTRVWGTPCRRETWMVF